MKIKTIQLILAGFASFVGSASATTVTAGGGTGGAQFVTSQGFVLTAATTAFQVGTLSVGVFTPFGVSDVAPIDISTVNNASFFGKWAGDTADTSAAATPFNGLQIWFRVTTSGAAGDGLAYFTGGQNFPVNANGVGDGITLNSNTLTTLAAGPGSTAGSAAYSLAGNTIPNSIVIGVIPEPSAALLGAIGALGLLRRRRN